MVLGNSETIPITKGQLAIGTWQVRALSEGMCVNARLLRVVWEGGGGANDICVCVLLCCHFCCAAAAVLHCCHAAAVLQQQSVMLVELDGPRNRTVGIQVVGQTGGPAASSS